MDKWVNAEMEKMKENRDSSLCDSSLRDSSLRDSSLRDFFNLTGTLHTWWPAPNVAVFRVVGTSSRISLVQILDPFGSKIPFSVKIHHSQKIMDPNGSQIAFFWLSFITTVHDALHLSVVGNVVKIHHTSPIITKFHQNRFISCGDMTIWIFGPK